MRIREKIKSFKLGIIFCILFISEAFIYASPSGEKTISTVTAIGPAIVTTYLTMFTESTVVGTTLPSGTITGVKLVEFSHNKDNPSDGVAWMGAKYKIEDTLKGEYLISNVRFTVINSKSANVDIDIKGDIIKIEVDDYFADDTSRQAIVEVIGDITYTAKNGNLGKGTIIVGNLIEAALYMPVIANLNLPIEVNNAIVLNTQPLKFGNVIPLTGKYEEESPIDITGSKGTEVTISLNGVTKQEVNDNLVSGRHKIPITYRIENGSGNMISELSLDAAGIGTAILKGVINSDNIPKGQVNGSYTGTVTIEVDYK